MFAKIDVNGENEDPLYTYLKDQMAGEEKDIEWNFAKFLINKNGEVHKRYHLRLNLLISKLILRVYFSFPTIPLD